MIAIGILYLPFWFYQGGYVFSIITLFIVSILSYMGYYRIISWANIVKGDIIDIANHCFGTTGKSIIIAIIVFSQIGFWTSYVVFICHAVLCLK